MIRQLSIAATSVLVLSFAAPASSAEGEVARPRDKARAAAVSTPLDLRARLPAAPVGWVSDGDVDPHGVFDPTRQAEQTYSRANGRDGNLSVLIFRPTGAQTLFTDERIAATRLGPLKENPARVLSRLDIAGRPALMEFERENGTGDISFRAGPYTVKVEGSSITAEELVMLARKVNVAALAGGAV